MKEIIETLYPMNRCLLGEGYDSALAFINHLIPLDILEFKSGETLGTWTVPNEWIVRDAWVKCNGEKIIDYKTQPLSLVVGSAPQSGIVSLEELKQHLYSSQDRPDDTPYVFKYYEHPEDNRNIDRLWGFCVPHNTIREKVGESATGKVMEDGAIEYTPTFKDKLEDTEYEVFIDTEYKPGVMKLGVHTIPGKSKREILLFAHLDHPFQANDNLSGVACLVDLARKLSAEHTIKIIFCPETIGSQAYALTQDITNVDFVIAVDICGNNNMLLLQKSWDPEHKINRIAHLAIHSFAQSYRKGSFRNTIGSDEYAFNDPLIGIPGILLSTHPYPEYHTSADTPDKIDYAMIERTQDVICKIIELWENDYIPVRNFKGPLMRSKYQVQSPSPEFNLSLDYFFYAMDGKRSLAELCCDYGLNFDFMFGLLEEMKVNHDISVAPRKKLVKQASK